MTDRNVRQMINNNFILSYKYPITITTDHQKITYVLNSFQNFIDLYCASIQQNRDPLYPSLKCDHAKDESSIKYPKFYIAVYTKPLNNHPFLLFGNLANKSYHIMVPIGNKAGHLQIDTVNNIAHHFNKEENFACQILLNKSIIMRQKSILQNPDFSLFKCGNIALCHQEIKQLGMKNITKKERENAIKKIESKYLDQAYIMVQHYFKLLKMGSFVKAKEFLRGGRYTFYQQTLKDFFKKDKNLLGHLEIFISLYKMISHLQKLY